MDNFFVTNLFDDWTQAQPSKKVRWVNNILDRLGIWVRLAPPKFSGGMTNVEQRMNMYHLITSVLVYDVSGDFVELGCNAGQSAVLFQKIINHYGADRKLHVYDSFEGLPDASPADGNTKFHKGQMNTTQDALLSNFKAAGLEPPRIHIGWFDKTLPTELPEKIAFAHLDGDFYDSIKVSLDYIYPRLSKGAICLIDDYCDPSVYNSMNELPGVKNACDEFLADKPEKVSVLYADSYAHGYFHKL